MYCCSLLVSAYYPTLKSFPRHVYKSKKLRMGIKIIRLKGLHSKQKRFWDILQKPDFIIGDSYYDFQAFISRLHLIGSPPNWVWWTILSQLIFDLLWSKSEIPTISKIKAREGANFGFSRFQPCLFSQIWRGSRIWTIKRTFEMCQRRVTKKNFMKFWQRAAEIWDLKEGQNRDFSSPISQPVTHLNVLFIVHIREPHQICEKRHG